MWTAPMEGQTKLTLSKLATSKTNHNVIINLQVIMMTNHVDDCY